MAQTINKVFSNNVYEGLIQGAPMLLEFGQEAFGNKDVSLYDSPCLSRDNLTFDSSRFTDNMERANQAMGPSVGASAGQGVLKGGLQGLSAGAAFGGPAGAAIGAGVGALTGAVTNIIGARRRRKKAKAAKEEAKGQFQDYIEKYTGMAESNQIMRDTQERYNQLASRY